MSHNSWLPLHFTKIFMKKKHEFFEVEEKLSKVRHEKEEVHEKMEKTET